MSTCVITEGVSGRDKVEQTLKEQTLSSYSFLDDGAKAKVIIPLAGATALPAGAVTCDFRDRSFDLRVGTATHVLRLHIPILLEEIDQHASTVRAREGKLLVWLVKRKPETNWYELRKTKGVGDTEFAKIVPDAGESVVFTL